MVKIIGILIVFLPFIIHAIASEGSFGFDGLWIYFVGSLILIFIILTEKSSGESLGYSASKFCRKCGHRLNSGSKFCKKCGTSLN